MSLVLWIATCHYGCQDLLDYVDDVFSHKFQDTMVLYPRYRMLLPRNQQCLLSCFNNLAVPHDCPKQTHDVSQPVIGMLVDAGAMSITMPADTKDLLVRAIDAFCSLRPRTKRLSRSL